MKILSEFKSFAMKGNVIDMAVGIIIGAGFGKIVTSMVNDIIMPPLGLIIGGVNFSYLKITLKEAVGGNQGITLNYGSFLQVSFDFLIVAIAVFIVIKAMNAARRKEAAPPASPPEPTKTEILLTEIRDLLKNN